MLYADGAAYDPDEDRWRMIASAPLSARRYHVVAWTGQEMIVVGGVGEEDGAAYRPESDSWRTISPPPIRVDGPLGTGLENLIGVVWTGSELVIWHVESEQVASYDPETNSWMELPYIEMGVDRGALRWDGREVYAFGETGYDYPETNQLSIARLRKDRWEMLPATELSTDTFTLGPVPTLTAWAGDRFLAWSDSGYEGKTMAFDPVADQWSQTIDVPSPPCEGQGEPLSAPGRVFAFGWCGPNLAMFESSSGVWTEVPVGGYPTARHAVWTGIELLNWGDTCCYGSGGKPFSVNAWRYRPTG